MPRGRLLTFNCHEAWIHQLGHLDFDLDIIDGLPGRYCAQWDTRMRPVPERARLVTLEDALSSSTPYDCIIAHSPTDLLDAKTLAGPRILMIHTTLGHRMSQEGVDRVPEGFTKQLEAYVDWIGAHVVAVSAYKG